MLIRLHKALSQAGISSRRQGEALILAGRIKVNGVVVRELGTKIDPQQDRLWLDNQEITLTIPTTPTVLLLHKPVGVLCTRHDPQGRPTIYDLLPPQYQHFYYVGRLDYHSSGALLLTNSGDLANHLTHPRYHIPKTYRVWLQGHPSDRTLQQWQRGILLEGKITLPAPITVLRTEPQRTCIEITLREGRNRQIRKTADLLGHPVLALHRTAIGNIHLHTLAVQQYRLLSPWEIQSLFTVAGGSIQTDHELPTK